ncbi:MAG: glutamate decarboxylase [Euryarchaeota archaeon]|nr:glutamate decarboxylase [Euryarchaeota archaeon]|tara:strand:+ start:3555 stop:5000 length:1446 start_codon:yes stop_codon:yes gene_type:complete
MEEGNSRFLESVLAEVLAHLEPPKDGRIRHEWSPSSLRKTTDLDLPLVGAGLDRVLDDIRTYLSQAVRTDQPGFMNPLWGGLTPEGLAGELVTAATNTSMYTYEIAPLASLIETAVLDRMRQHLRMPTGAGTLTTGGSNGNLMGVLCARQAALPASGHDGFDGRSWCMFVSKEAHYSVAMAANVLGLGRANLIKVDTDGHGRMDPSALDHAIRREANLGRRPLCVVATSGTTVRGAFDSIDGIADVCETHGVWLHVDAAWGGSCLFSTTHRHLMDGVERADSVCWDAHKMMGLPLVCSAFIVKRADVLRAACAHGNEAHYLFHDDAEDQDLGRLSLQCGRRNDALKLFLAWRSRGDAGWGALVDQYMDLAGHLAERVRNEPDLELVGEPTWTNVCFRHVPGGLPHLGEAIDAHNAALRAALLEEGKFMVSRADLDQRVVLRSVIANPAVEASTLDDLVDHVLRLARTLPVDAGSQVEEPRT